MNKIIHYLLTAYIIILLITSFNTLGILNFVPIYATIIYLVCSSTLGILSIKGIIPKYFNPKNRSDLITIIGFLDVFVCE
jgi:hypothetical protein